MASARFAWGIDVGNRALKAVKLVRDGEQLRVDDFELFEHEHVLSNAGDNRESLIQTALAHFVQRHQTKGGIVAVGVAGQSSFARFIKLPPVEAKKINEIVRFEAVQQIPFPLEDVEWSYQLFQSPDSPDVEVGIFAMRKELINRHISFFTDFDMNVQVVQMNPLAVYNAMYYDQRLKGTTMLIDLGAENTDLIICDNETIWMRSIPIGGNNFTETLVKAFKLPFAKAEDLKRNASASKYARQIFQAMRPVFADLVAEIQRSMGFYASVHRDSRIKKIIALGGTFRLPALQKYLQQNLSLEVERPDNISAGAPADPKLAATFNENLLSVISAYGLAIQAMGEGKITSSLLPASIRREKLWKQKTPVFAASTALFCLGTGIALGGYFYQNLRFEAAASQRETIARIENEARRLDAEWSQIESAGASDRALISNVLSFTQYRDLWPRLLSDIYAAVPKPQDVVLSGLRENNPQKIKQVQRAQREQIIIESITSRYVPNFATLLSGTDQDFRRYATEGALPAAPSGIMPAPMSGFGPMMPPPIPGDEAPPPPVAAAGESTGPRGFLLIIKGTSPYANAGTLIETRFCDALKDIKPTPQRPNMPYAVEKAVTVSVNQFKENPSRLAQIKQAYDALLQAQQRAGEGRLLTNVETAGEFSPGGFPGRMGMLPPAGGPAFGPTGIAGVEDPTPYMDRLLGDEDVRNDWEFTVLVAVRLDPPPPTSGTPPQ